MYGNLVSVIVPIYNVEKYLEKCIESIVNQTYKNLEIILVDDGSPDNCPAICDEWAQKDSRIKVIHKKNGGLSSARNAGLEVSNGEYISFVDSDDWLDENTFEEVYNNFLKELYQCIEPGPEKNRIKFLLNIQCKQMTINEFGGGEVNVKI